MSSFSSNQSTNNTTATNNNIFNSKITNSTVIAPKQTNTASSRTLTSQSGVFYLKKNLIF